MINSIIVTNELGRSLAIDLRHPERTGLAITNITGLGPVKSTINVTELVTDDGGVFNSARMGTRNIVFTIKYLWVNTIEEARLRTYEYFPIKKRLTLTFFTDRKSVQIVGYVEANDPTIFDEAAYGQISVICPNPYFYSILDGGVQTTFFSNVESLFEFPFENNSLTESLIEMSSSSSIFERNIIYRGDAEVGLMMTIQINGNVKNIRIHNLTTDKHMVLETDKLKAIVGEEGLKSGDILTINTMKGEKSAILYRDGKYTSVLSMLSKNTDWIEFVTGDNDFAYTADEGISNLVFKVENVMYYQGI